MTIFPSEKSGQITAFAGVGIFVLTLVLYLLTAYPTVAYIDSGELAIVNWTLGIAHPTGYPLYTILGRLFSLLPLSLITTQIFMGALCAAAAVTVLFLVLMRLSADGRRLSVVLSAIATLTLAAAPLVWSQGSTNEVYALHLLFISLMIYLLFSKFTFRRALLFCLLLGLSFGNHLSTSLTLPAFAAYIWINRRPLFANARAMLLGVAALVAAGSLYLYLPLRSLQNPVMNWGHPTNWENFLRHVSGWQYRVWMFDRSVDELLNHLVEFANILFTQFPLTFWPLVVAGIWFGFRQHRRRFFYIILILCFNVIYALNFSIPDIDNYLLPAVVAIFLVAGFAAVEMVRRSDAISIVAAILIAASLPLGMIVNWQRQDQSGNYAATDGVENFFRSCEPNALILCANWDYVSPWLYLHFYEKRRTDVIVIDPELARRSWYPDFIEQLDSSLYRHIKPEIEAFLPQVKRFEAGLPYDPREIESPYQKLLKKIMSYPERPIYLDISVQLNFEPPGKLAVSGKLLRLVREGEPFATPSIRFQQLRFGKAEKYLSQRERWHVELSHRLEE